MHGLDVINARNVRASVREAVEANADGRREYAIDILAATSSDLLVQNCATIVKRTPAEPKNGAKG